MEAEAQVGWMARVVLLVIGGGWIFGVKNVLA